MKNEIIGICPCCMEAEKSACVDIYVSRNERGEITNMYIFGDDHFDVPPSNQDITDITVSDDGKTVIYPSTYGGATYFAVNEDAYGKVYTGTALAISATSFALSATSCPLVLIVSPILLKKSIFPHPFHAQWQHSS